MDLRIVRVRRVGQIARRYYKAAQVTASVSTHVPKPHTPFQWAAMDSEAQARLSQIRSQLGLSSAEEAEGEVGEASEAGQAGKADGSSSAPATQ